MELSTCMTVFNMLISPNKGLPAYLIAAPLIGIAVPFAIVLIVSCASSESSKNDTTIRYPKVTTWLGGVIFAVTFPIWVVGLVYGYNTKPEFTIFFRILSTVLTMLPLNLFMLCFNVRLTIAESQLIYRDFFGVTRKYRYEDIQKIISKRSKGSPVVDKYVICIGRRKIRIEYPMVNFDNFAEMMKSRLRKVKNEARFDIKQY